MQDERSKSQMSVVVRFPSARVAARGSVRNRSSQGVAAVHLAPAGSVVSWVRPAACECCGRPTLAGRRALDGVTLCGHCCPPNVA